MIGEKIIPRSAAHLPCRLFSPFRCNLFASDHYVATTSPKGDVDNNGAMNQRKGAERRSRTFTAEQWNEKLRLILLQV
ncbi:MAG TPA: hypothetical protein ENK84_03325 [Desulfobulbus sp.]|nr:hypothetical protein [Desulfobulbus sp.]